MDKLCWKLGALALLALCSRSALATSMLFDWGFNLDGTTYCQEGPCDNDTLTPGDLPGAIDASGFDFETGLGTVLLSIGPGAPGGHSVDAFFDHEIDEPLNSFFNEFGATSGTAAAGQTWEIDEPGFFFGDIFTNFALSVLANDNALPAGSPEDVSMALGWDFTLAAGQSALIAFTVGTVLPADFALIHTDPDSGESIYLSSVLEFFNGTPVPAPPMALLLGAGLITILRRRRVRPRRR